MRGKILPTFLIVVVIAIIFMAFLYIGYARIARFQDSTKQVILVDNKKLESFIDETFEAKRPKLLNINLIDSGNLVSDELDIYSPTLMEKPRKPVMGCKKPESILGGQIVSVNVRGNLQLLKSDHAGKSIQTLNSILLQCIAYGVYSEKDFEIFRENVLTKYRDTQIFNFRSL